MGTFVGLAGLVPAVAIIGAVVWGVWLSDRATKARRALLRQTQQWALARDWTYLETNPTLTQGWAIEPFRSGSQRTVFGLAAGTFDGLAMATGGFERVVSNGKSSTRQEFTVAVVCLPVTLPPLILRPEYQRIGRRELNLESPEFNDRWWATCASTRFGYDFLHPRMMERLSGPDSRELTLAIQGSDLLLVQTGIAPLAVRDRWFRLLADVVDLVPDFVWANFGAAAPTVADDGPGVSFAEQQRRIGLQQQRDQQDPRVERG